MIKKYYKHLKDLSLINSSIALLYQDMETHMPTKADEERWEQIWILSEIYHKKLTNKAFWKIIYTLWEQWDTLKKEDQRSVVLSKKQYDNACKVPSGFIKKFEKVKLMSQIVWTKAKQENNFKIWLPHLRKIFTLSKQYAQYINPNKNPYNVLLDIYEEGYTIKDLEKNFEEIKGKLQEIIKQEPNKEKKQIHYNQEEFPKHKVHEFYKELVSIIGFNLDRGNIGDVHHPYQTTISANDIRINTNYTDFISWLTGIIHELWHGLYEQNIDEIFHFTNLHSWASLWIHESQSRLLENIIGKDKPFLIFLLSLLKKHFPNRDRKIDDIYNHLTNVKPSLIRIEADEVSYNMHIIIRFEIEQALLSGELNFKDLPKVRNKKMEEYLGIKVPSDKEGCMQDVHQSIWAIWYFPTYTLWNLISAQLRNSFTKINTNRKSEIEKWNFSNYCKRFKKHIWQHWSLYTPKVLINQATWEDLNTKYFLDYLTKKYS